MKKRILFFICSLTLAMGVVFFNKTPGIEAEKTFEEITGKQPVDFENTKKISFLDLIETNEDTKNLLNKQTYKNIQESELESDLKPEVVAEEKNTNNSRVETSKSTETITQTQPVKEPDNIYKYCPTYINGNIFYCSNEDNPGNITDGIFLNDTKVLGTTPNDWDSVQVCDPTVIQGAFSYNNCTYQYLMAYLGCATYDCTANEIGFAVSNDLYNWTKVGKVVSANRDGFWGVGQPSLLNIDNNIFLFYTSGTRSKTTTYVELLDCSNLNDIKHINKTEITTPYDFISNADFAFEENALYMICDTHPFSGGNLNFISDKQTIYKMNWDKTFEGLNNSWEKYSEISNAQTGYLKNHNACFTRDGSGRLLSKSAYVSIAKDIGSFTNNLWTYRFYLFNF